MKCYILSILITLLAASCSFAATFTSANGFSIDLPDGWQALSQEQMKTMGGSTDLFARDPEAAKSGKTLSVTGKKSTVSDKATVASVVDQLKADPRIKGDVKSEVKSFGGFDWTKLTYNLEVNGKIRGIAQYIAINSNFLYTFSFSADDLSAYEPIFDRAMESFR
jgi:hypothetical protein